MPREAFVQREILRLYGAHPRIRLWRANAGRGLVPTASGGLRPVKMNIDGCPDTIGWTSVPVSRLLELGIHEVAIFTGIECKSDRGVVREAQEAFRDVLLRMGGIHTIARSMGDVDRMFGRWV